MHHGNALTLNTPHKPNTNVFSNNLHLYMYAKMHIGEMEREYAANDLHQNINMLSKRTSNENEE